jgi:ABC-2 type transport system ATP-binding protein
MIQIENLSKSFGTHEVLRNINLTLEKGKVYGIVGENGSGKTTLFKCIAGLERFSGAVRSKFDILKDHVGFLQTEPYFFSKITGSEYLRFLTLARKIKTTDLQARNIFELPLDQYADT